MRLFFLFVFCSFFGISISAQNWDINTLRKINVNRNQSLDGTFKFISDSDTPIILAGPLSVLAVGLINKDRMTIEKGLVMGGTLCLNGILTTGLKFAVNRHRPYETYPDIQKLDKAGSHSFPSGHTSSAFAFATSISLAYPRWYVIAPSFAWAGLVGYSRMHLGVHYPTDVIIGALLGVGSGFLMHWVGKNVLTLYPGY